MNELLIGKGSSVFKSRCVSAPCPAQRWQDLTFSSFNDIGNVKVKVSQSIAV